MEWERATWIAEYEAGEKISEIGRQHQISRKTLHKWIERYQQYGSEGLCELSRAPAAHPQAVSELWRERIRGARIEHGRWGAPKLRWLLEQRHGKPGVPSESTIGRVLQESGLSGGRRREVRAHGTGHLHPAEHPNEVWGIDFKGWCRTGDGKRCEPLTITDQVARYLLCCQGLRSTRTELVRPVMERVFREYGLPERLRNDNGPPFASIGECGLTELSVWWIELGIGLERIDPGHPQQNGRHERMHRTLQEETMLPPAASMRVQQRRFDAFRREFNEQRPHQALGQQIPAAVYRSSARRYPERTPQPSYPPAWGVRRIGNGGQLRWLGERFFVSHALTGKPVALEPAGEGLWRMWFYQHWLGMWDQTHSRLWRPRQWQRRMKGTEQSRPASP